MGRQRNGENQRVNYNYKNVDTNLKEFIGVVATDNAVF